MANRIANLLGNTKTRTLVLLIIGVLIFGIVIAVSQSESVHTKDAPERLSKTAEVPSGIKSTPGDQVSRKYRELQDQANARGAEEAARKGETFIPTLTGNTEGYSDTDFDSKITPVGDQNGVCSKQTVDGLKQSGLDATGIIMQLKASGCSAAFISSMFSPDQLAAALLAGSGYGVGGKCSIDDAKKLKNQGSGATAIAISFKSDGCSASDIAKALKGADFNSDDIAMALKDLCNNPKAIATALKSAGFSAAEISLALKGAGIAEPAIAAALISIGANDAQASAALKDVGFTGEQIIKAIKASKIKSCKADDAKKLKDLSYDADTIVTLLENNGCSANDLAISLKAANFNPSIIAIAMKAKCFSSNQIAAALKVAGFSDEQTASALKAAGAPAAEIASALAKAGASEQQIAAALKASGFSDGQINSALQASKIKGCSGENAKRLKDLGLDANAIVAVLKNNGCSIEEIYAAMRAAGFSDEQIANAMKAAGFSSTQIAAASQVSSAVIRCSAEDANKMKAQGMDANKIAGTLKNNGCTIANITEALKGSGFSNNEIAAGLQASGVSAQDIAQALKASGANASEIASALAKAGFSSTDILPSINKAGFNSTDIAKAMSSLESKSALETAALVAQTPDQDAAQRLAAQQESQQLAAYGQQRAAKMQELMAAMQAQQTQIMSSWTEIPQQALVPGQWAVAKSDGSSATLFGSIGSGSTTKTSTEENNVILKAGSILFAVIDTAVNSDQPGPIAATIVSGALKGSKLLGTMKVEGTADVVSLTFTAINIPSEPKSMGIEAVAIDPDTARTAIASDVDHHYLLRWGSLFASSFMQGFSSAVANSGQTSTTSSGTTGTTTTTTSQPLNPKQQLFQGLSAVGTKWSDIVSKNFDTPATITIDQGTGVGILITSDFSYGSAPQFYSASSTSSVAAGANDAGSANGSTGASGAASSGAPAANLSSDQTAALINTLLKQQGPSQVATTSTGGK